MYVFLCMYDLVDMSFGSISLTLSLLAIHAVNLHSLLAHALPRKKFNLFTAFIKTRLGGSTAIEYIMLIAIQKVCKFERTAPRDCFLASNSSEQRVSICAMSVCVLARHKNKNAPDS